MEARNAGVSCIYGFIVNGDLTANPRLPEWYQKRGFEVIPPNPDNPHDDRWFPLDIKIVRYLTPSDG